MDVKPALASDDIPIIVRSFQKIGWNKPESLYRRYIEEQNAGVRKIWTTWLDQDFAGYVTLCLQSDYEPFREKHIPEIKDLNILLGYRRRGFGSNLLKHAEKEAFTKSRSVGIGVGLTCDYAAAHLLYLKRGFRPDGNGIAFRGKTLSMGETCTVEDDLCLMMTLQNQ